MEKIARQKTQILTGIATGTPTEVFDQLQREVTEFWPGEDSPKLLMVFASTAHPLSSLTVPLAKAWPKTTVVGCSTAGEFTEKGDRKAATSWFALSGDFEISAGLGHGLSSDPLKAVSQAVEGLVPASPGYPHQNAILLLDPLAGGGEEAVLVAASILGEQVRLAGGAAGDDLQMKSTEVALGSEIASHALVLVSIASRQPLGLGVCHGHLPLSAPLQVTRAEGNVVHEIEGRSAWEVWKEKTRDAALVLGIDPEQLSKEDEGAFLLRYEAGLATGDEYKIRAPLSRDDSGAIHFACGIPEGAVFQITESTPERQIESAREAARRARVRLGEGVEVAGALVFDCICRNLILDAGFEGAVKAIASELGEVPLAGFETYGEIALDAGDLSGFHNTTTVVLAFPDSPEESV